MSKIILIALSLLLTIQPAGQSRLSNRLYNALYERQISMTFVGDIMVHGAQHRSARRDDGYDFNPCFQYVAANFQAADLMVGNLETTLTERDDVSGYPVFRSPIQLADALKNAGFDVLVTANNHSLDNRLYGVETTLKALRERGLASTGTYRHDEAVEPLVVEKNGFKIGFIASTYGTNGFPLPSDYPHVVNLNDIALYERQIALLEAQQVDLIIAFVHWGNEYQRQPSEAQIDFANQLADLGVDAIIGSHPHVIQPDGWIGDERDCYVVYSLGNVISNQRWRYSDCGLAVSLTFQKNGNQAPKISAVDYLPFWVDKHDQSGRVDYVMIPLDNPPDLARLSAEDKVLMREARDDFKQLYQIDDFKRPLD